MQTSGTSLARNIDPNRRFYALDGIRGIAALTVVLYHYLDPIKYTCLINSYIAVDLFFFLSGFVIYHSYAEKVMGGMKAGAFINHRFARLMPTVAVGVALGACARLAYFHAIGQRVDPVLYTLVHVGHVFFIPDFIDYKIPATGIPELFPSNRALWSIFFEFFASVSFIALVRLPRWGLIAGSLTMYGLLVLGCIHHSAITGEPLTPQVGWSAETLNLGFVRVLFAFMGGMAICALTQKAGPASTAALPHFRGLVPTYAIYAAALVILLFPFTLSDVYPFFAIAVLCPLLIAFGSRVVVEPQWLRTLSDWLGKLSFPLYCLHVPIRRLVEVYLEDIPSRLQVILSLSLAVLVSILVFKLFDWLRVSERVRTVLKPVTG
jgi:peptidoglycan/LPS O-acetylase OafA/YrhL